MNSRQTIAPAVIALISGLLIVWMLPAEGALIYSNIGPGESFSGSTSVTAAGPTSIWGESSAAARFVAIADGHLGTVEVGVLSGKSIYETAHMDLWIATDGGGLPGTIIETASGTMTGGTRGLSMVMFGGTTMLTAGTSYWIGMSAPADDWFWWYVSDPAVAGRIGYKTTGAWDAFDYYAGPSLRVSTVSDIPEPGAGFLLLSGWLIAVLRRRGG